MALKRNPLIDKVGETWGPDQHLWWNYWMTQDYFWSIDQWPDWAQRDAMRWHKNDSQMYNLMYFFVANGLPPLIAGRWTLTGHVKSLGNGKLAMLDDAPAQYKQKELYDLQRVITKAEAGELLSGKKQVFSMVEGRVLDF